VTRALNVIFIDYNTLLLVNMAAGLAVLAGYVYWGLDDPDQKRWAPAFAISGLVALVFGGHLTVTWVLPGPYNAAFGEMSVLLGAIFLGAALCFAKGWSPLLVAVYAFPAGIAAIVLGVRILGLGLTGMPLLTAIGFVLSGLGGVFAAPTLAWLRGSRLFRALAALALLGAALDWAATAYLSYWMHMDLWQPWLPVIRQTTGS
jgi:putative membrane protein